MQTTLSIDEDVLAAAEELADFHQKSLGEVISSLARQSLHSDGATRIIKHGICLEPAQQESTPATV